MNIKDEKKLTSETEYILNKMIVNQGTVLLHMHIAKGYYIRVDYLCLCDAETTLKDKSMNFKYLFIKKKTIQNKRKQT